MKQTKPNKGEGQKQGWCYAFAKADREVRRWRIQHLNIMCVWARLYVLILAGKFHQTGFGTDGRRDHEKETAA